MALFRRIGEGGKRSGEALLNIVFPRRCPVCGDIVTPDGGRICGGCVGILKYAEEPCCLKCGVPLKDDADGYCPGCSGRERFFDRGRAAFIYDDVLSLSIYGFKYHGRQEYAAFYADEIIKRLGRFIEAVSPEALVPIPLHKSRYRKRGYNQAELIAERLSRRLGIPCEPGLLIREKNTKPQKDLGEKERQNNLKKAFKIGRNDVSLSTVMLIDDIYTTGSTMDSAAACLKENGVKGVFFIVLSASSML